MKMLTLIELHTLTEKAVKAKPSMRPQAIRMESKLEALEQHLRIKLILQFLPFRAKRVALLQFDKLQVMSVSEDDTNWKLLNSLGASERFVDPRILLGVSKEVFAALDKMHLDPKLVSLTWNGKPPLAIEISW